MRKIVHCCKANGLHLFAHWKQAWCFTPKLLLNPRLILNPKFILNPKLILNSKLSRLMACVPECPSSVGWRCYQTGHSRHSAGWARSAGCAPSQAACPLPVQVQLHCHFWLCYWYADCQKEQDLQGATQDRINVILEKDIYWIMNECMDQCMDQWVDGWMDEGVGGWVGGWIGECM